MQCPFDFGLKNITFSKVFQIIFFFLKKKGKASFFCDWKESSWLATFGCCLGHEGPGVGGHPGPGPPVFSFFRGRYLGRAEGRSDGGNCTGYLRPISTNLYKVCFWRGWIMLLVVRVLLLVEVPQTIGLVHKRFPRLLVQFLPPANIQSVFKIQPKPMWA